MLCACFHVKTHCHLCPTSSSWRLTLRLRTKVSISPGNSESKASKLPCRRSSHRRDAALRAELPPRRARGGGPKLRETRDAVNRSALSRLVKVLVQQLSSLPSAKILNPKKHRGQQERGTMFPGLVPLQQARTKCRRTTAKQLAREWA